MDIINDPVISGLREELESQADAGAYSVSDLLLNKDGRTLQFVDLVMEGGGTLGIALVGYIYGLECAGIRFLSVGGSSVGAIVALLLACAGNRDEAKGEKLTEVISTMHMNAFIDGGPVSATFSKLLGSGGAVRHKLLPVLLGAASVPRLLKTLGLNPGDCFLEWLERELAKFGVYTYRDAKKHITKLPNGMFHRFHGSGFDSPALELKLVAADLTTGTKVIFPHMASLYWEEPEDVNPALFARASMSIPLFFEPMEVQGITEIVESSSKWRLLCDFEGDIPDKICFADGGLLSNFPIELFHENKLPEAPTFGVRLGDEARVVREIDSMGIYLRQLFNSMRIYGDNDFIMRNPDYRRLISYIPVGDHSWLNFNMSEEQMLDLFRRGMARARGFLKSFDWPRYKAIRSLKLQHDLI